MEYRGSLNLSVPGDLIAVPVVITQKELDADAGVMIKIEYQENSYLGVGKSLEWTDAFADLQKALPDGVNIQSCMTCRHGTLCPYGMIPDCILCSQNAVITNKDDVIDWFDKVDVKDVKRSSLGHCEKYEAANENAYTYNDYLYHLDH